MATKKTAAAKVAPTVSPDPADQIEGGAPAAPADETPSDVFVPDAIEIGADAPEPVVPSTRAVTPAGTGATPAGTGTSPTPAPTSGGTPAPAAGVTTPGAAGGAKMASTIPVVVGTAGYYTGARRAETKAEYQARLGNVYGTFGDLGWILGTSPRT